ncbi:hypothetical protein LBMAG56_07930 [Verrucomicrobiota bacterium]|nr:hypothetical protein LBMAG56_07930 [Verrucomicrobiota bacterium]
MPDEQTGDGVALHDGGEIFHVRIFHFGASVVNRPALDAKPTHPFREGNSRTFLDAAWAPIGRHGHRGTSPQQKFPLGVTDKEKLQGLWG